MISGNQTTAGDAYRRLKLKADLIRSIRSFFNKHDYLEVDTPLLCPELIPEAHIEPVFIDKLYLQASPELCMKRLLSAGFERIFQICKCFRKHERGLLHLPEFTMLEWYTRNNDYNDLMNQCSELIRTAAEKILGTQDLQYQGHAVDLESPWLKISVKDAFEQYADISLASALQQDCFDEVISFQIEPAFKKIYSPVFLYDYPASQASLSKLHPKKPDTAQRFELYIAGIELANGFTELNDPSEQRQRLVKENHLRVQQGKQAAKIPEKFLADLAKMPEAAGIAMGIERLAMIFGNCPAIDDVVSFTPENM